LILWHCTTVEPEVIEANGLQPGKDSWKDWIEILSHSFPPLCNDIAVNGVLLMSQRFFRVRA
jgi:hypothetical protein